MMARSDRNVRFQFKTRMEQKSVSRLKITVTLFNLNAKNVLLGRADRVDERPFKLCLSCCSNLQNISITCLQPECVNFHRTHRVTLRVQSKTGSVTFHRTHCVTLRVYSKKGVTFHRTHCVTLRVYSKKGVTFHRTYCVTLRVYSEKGVTFHRTHCVTLRVQSKKGGTFYR